MERVYSHAPEGDEEVVGWYGRGGEKGQERVGQIYPHLVPLGE